MELLESEPFGYRKLSIQLALFAFLLFTARGVPTEESIRVVVLIATEIFVGAEIWKRLIKDHQIQSIEILGMGFAIGSAIFTIIDQLIIRSGIQINELLVPIVTVTLTIVLKSRVRIEWSSTERLQTSTQSSIFLTLCVFLGFGELTYGSLLAVLILIGLLLAKPKWVSSKWNRLIISTAGVCGSIFLYSQFKPHVAYSSWFLRPLYTGTDDAVFSESIAYSVAHFGSSEHAAAQGTNLRYHWFSLAWSGMVDRVASTSPFTMTLHVVPVITFMAIAALLLAVSIRLNMNGYFIFIAPLILFATSTAPGSTRFFHVLNTSNVLPYVWTLALVLVIVLFCKSEINFANHLIVFFLAVILLAKIPYAVAPLTGLVCMHLYSAMKDWGKLKATVIQLTVTFVTLSTVFVAFLTPNKWEKRQFKIDWNLMHAAHGSNYRFIIAPVFILILLVTRFPLIFMFKTLSVNKRLRVFLIGAIFTGLFRFVLNGSSAEFYFFNSALLFGSIAVAIVVSDIVNENVQLKNRTFLTIGIVSMVISFISIKLWDWLSSTYGLSRFEMIQMAFPLIISVFLTLIFYFKISKYDLFSPLRAVSLAMIVSLTFAGIGIFITQTINTPTYSSFGGIATREDIDSLNWLRNNSKVDAVIATNRGICTGSDPCGFDESSFLISAVAHRRVLIEGPRFVTGGRPYPDWVNERIQKSLAFANSPSNTSFYNLKNMGVTWYFMDTNYLSDSAISSNTSWGEWAELVHQNSNILILKLRS